MAAQPELQERIEKEIRVMLSRHGKNRRLMEYLGDLYLRHREYDKAFELYERRAQGEIDAGEILHDALQRILSPHPTHLPSLRAEVEYYHGIGQYAEALAMIDRYVQAGGQADNELRLIEMKSAEETGDLDRALASGHELVSSQPEDTAL